MNMGWPYMTGTNPYNPQPFTNYNPTSVNVNAPQMQVPRVNGKNSAEMFPIGPNSSALLLDESGVIVWLVTTDASGYKTVNPYDITPHKDLPAPNYSDLEKRIEQLEALVNGNTNNTTTTKCDKPTTDTNRKPTTD